MKHIAHFFAAAVGVVVAAVPAIIASPAVVHFISAHPVYAAYFPILSGIVAALAHAAHGRVSAP